MNSKIKQVYFTRKNGEFQVVGVYRNSDYKHYGTEPEFIDVILDHGSDQDYHELLDIAEEIAEQNGVELIDTASVPFAEVMASLNKEME